ncbi:unnamed protein product [Ceratitis capitata]|uniref:(Mediterranean fruit fly) hypothetical protein n=1 Tax=Ceratitis capitata TaxID=7213 RepID=A0A811U9F5_CERCA|nr:unnamed protein product [Ceratitis capitata]
MKFSLLNTLTHTHIYKQTNMYMYPLSEPVAAISVVAAGISICFLSSQVARLLAVWPLSGLLAELNRPGWRLHSLTTYTRVHNIRCISNANVIYCRCCQPGLLQLLLLVLVLLWLQ